MTSGQQKPKNTISFTTSPTQRVEEHRSTAETHTMMADADQERLDDLENPP